MCIQKLIFSQCLMTSCGMISFGGLLSEYLPCSICSQKAKLCRKGGIAGGALTSFLCGLKNACKMTPVKRQNNLPHGKISFKYIQALCFCYFILSLLQLKRFSLVSLNLRSFSLKKTFSKKFFYPLWLSEVY